jgi:hypothetical protein
MWDIKRSKKTGSGIRDPAVGGRRSAVGGRSEIGEALRPESKSFSDPRSLIPDP